MNISGEHAISIHVTLLGFIGPWKWRQQAPLKHRYMYTNLQGVIIKSNFISFLFAKEMHAKTRISFRHLF